MSSCANDKERDEMLSLIKDCSILTWSHVNLHGEYNFRRKAVNEHRFNLAKIFALHVA